MTTQLNSTITIRRYDLAEADQAALAKLASLDSRAALDGHVLGAEVEGRLLAAISMETGEVIADPFSRTSEMRAMLKLRRAATRVPGSSGGARGRPSAAPPPGRSSPCSESARASAARAGPS